MTRPMYWRALLIALALATAAAALVAVMPRAEAKPPAKPEKGVNWSSCYRDIRDDITADIGGAPFFQPFDYECANVKVPLDHDKPNGASVNLSVLRIPALDQENKIGSIFLNPGGPGGSGVDFALFFGPFAGLEWGPDIRARFDIVGFDPRGIGRSTPVRCFGNERQAAEVFPPFAFPRTPEEESTLDAANELLADRCDQRGSKTTEHASTANVARDLDHLRQAVGDSHLNYVGLSYGSYLGQTYANLFPERVRAVVIDGVLDPIAWANTSGSDGFGNGEIPFSTRLRSDLGARATLDKFFEFCDITANCGIQGASSGRYAAIAAALRTDVYPLPYSDFIGITLGNMYSPFGWYDFGQFLGAVEAAIAGTGTWDDVFAALGGFEATTEGFVNKRGFPNYVNFAESFPAVACEDGDNPTDTAVWSALAADTTTYDEYFGPLWTWASSPCGKWALEDDDRYRGPWTADTENPVLVIGNLYDPATRYEGAQTAASLLPNSALLTVDDPGHTSLGLSPCAGFITGQYLIDPDAAAAAFDGETCPPAPFNWVDFGAPSAAPFGDFGYLSDMRTRLMVDIAYRPIR